MLLLINSLLLMLGANRATATYHDSGGNIHVQPSMSADANDRIDNGSPIMSKQGNEKKGALKPPSSLCGSNHTNCGERDEKHYMTVEELYRSHGPGDCGSKSKFEGEAVHVRGYIDRDNIFDKKSHPKLPYEKFKICDKQSGKSIEVWAVSDKNWPIFKKIHQNVGSSNKEAFVSGTIVSFDMPVMGTCRKGVKLEIRDVRDISFR